MRPETCRLNLLHLESARWSKVEQVEQKDAAPPPPPTGVGGGGANQLSNAQVEQGGANAMSVTKVKPIETRWKGYRFRSRLEARWAVFFETAGIRWQYEPEATKHWKRADHGDKGYSWNHPKLLYAAIVARSARFEHGEQP